MFPPHPVQQWWTVALCTKDTSKLKCGHNEPNGPKTWPHPAVTEGVVAVSGGQWSSIFIRRQKGESCLRRGTSLSSDVQRKDMNMPKLSKQRGLFESSVTTCQHKHPIIRSTRAQNPPTVVQTLLTWLIKHHSLHLEFKPDQHGGLFRNWSLFISPRWKILWTRTVTDTPPKHDATTTVRYCEGCN